MLHVDTTSSTNGLALDYARRGAPHGSLFVAREQTGGKGRYERRWESPPGGLYLSVLIRPEPEDPVPVLPHVTAVAAAEAVIDVTGVDVRLRWPNDLYATGRKLGGILCEGSFRGSGPEAFVAGVGINVSQRPGDFSASVQRRATSLHVLHGREVDPLDVAIVAVSRLERWWKRRDAGGALARFRELAEGDVGRPIEVQPRGGEPFRAVSRGISEDGGLVIELEDGAERILYSDDVVQLRDGDWQGA